MKNISLKQAFEACMYYDLRINGGGSVFIIATFQGRPCGHIRQGKAKLEQQFIVVKNN